MDSITVTKITAKQRVAKEVDDFLQAISARKNHFQFLCLFAVILTHYGIERDHSENPVIHVALALRNVSQWFAIPGLCALTGLSDLHLIFARQRQGLARKIM